MKNNIPKEQKLLSKSHGSALDFNRTSIIKSNDNYETIIHSMPWLQKSTSLGSSNSCKKRTNAVTIYPLFLKLSEFVDDPDWKSILIDSSKGKLLKGFNFNGNNLIFKSNNKIINLDENQTSVTNFINFVRNCAGMRSKMDLEREKDLEREQFKEDDVSQEWFKIKSKFTKRMLIIDYVDKLKGLYQLNEKETNQLSTLITLNMNKDVIKKNVVLHNFAIVKINSLLWDKNKRIFMLNGLSNKVYEIKHDNVYYYDQQLSLNIDKVSTLKEWNKFLKEFNKITKKIDNDYSISVKNKQLLSSNNSDFSVKSNSQDFFSSKDGISEISSSS